MGNQHDAPQGLPPERPAGGRRSQVYVLRMWSDEPDGPWRLSLRTPDGGAAIGMADLDELVVFLLRQMALDGPHRRDSDD